MEWNVNDYIETLKLESLIRNEDAKSFKLKKEHPLVFISKHLQKQSPKNAKKYSEESLTLHLASELGLPFAQMDPTKLNYSLFDNFVSLPFARKNLLFPLELDGDTLIIACGNPNIDSFKEEIKLAIKNQISFVLAPPSKIRKWLDEFYYFHSNINKASQDFEGFKEIHSFQQLAELTGITEQDQNESSVVKSVDYILENAVEQRATDIHFEPKSDSSLVRLRIDGVLHNIFDLPRNVHNAFLARLKNMARMDMAERRRPQDGRIMAVIKHEKIEFRASTLPVGTGEKLVLRVLKTKWARQSFEKLGMVKKDRDLVEKIVHRPNGLILVTGPTGSGKSTSLYNMLLQVADGEKNITSIEDPIEYLFDEFNQVAVQSRLGMDFPEVIKACLRQDPDILMIGEIRDKVTASMAITASLTGHLVFSTLHTNSAIAAISRLRDLDQENFLIADTLLAVISQRLVRKVCQFCKDWKAPDKKERAVLEGFNLEMEKIAFGLGCEKCRKTGYFGRIGLFEIIPMDQDLLELVSLNESIETIEKIARKKFSKDLLKDGLSKIKSGETTISEVLNKVFDSKNFS